MCLTGLQLDLSWGLRGWQACNRPSGGVLMYGPERTGRPQGQGRQRRLREEMWLRASVESAHSWPVTRWGEGWIPGPWEGPCRDRMGP